MTPEAISLIAKLRGEFYSLFAAAMKVPVKITAHSYSRNFPIACWVNSRQQLNYLSLYAHSAPDELFPLRPLLLRVAVNRGAGSVVLVKPGLKFRDLNQGRHFELTATPEEIIDFVPWLVSLIETHEQVTSNVEVKSPPHPLEFVLPVTCSCRDAYNHAWTEKAWSQTNETMAQLIELRTNPSTLHRSNEASLVFSL